jgi:type II secretory pathway component PulJ
MLELMCMTALLGALLAGIFSTIHSARTANAACESCALDVLGMTRALAALERDCRESTAGGTSDGGVVVLETPRGAILWGVRAGALFRRDGGVESVLARGVARCSVEPEGPVLRIRIRLEGTRSAGGRGPEATSLVARRAAEEGR